jgi:signal transduction histidine kinase
LGQYFNDATKPLIVENLQDIPRHDPFFDLLQHYKSGRFLISPLVVENEAIAWVILGDVVFRHFSADDISLIRRVTNLIASALAKFRLKEERQRLEGLYYQAQKMAMIGQLSVNVTRNFSNLLTAINGYAWVMKSELEADNPHQYLVTSILSLSRHTADLARQLLAFNRQQSSKLQTLDINNVIVQMEKILRYMLGEGITLESTLTPMIWSIKAEPSQIGQIIINMAINAYDAMQGEGRLTIETSNVILDNTCKNRYLQAKPGEYVAWTISDTGAGISAEAKAHIFDPFFSTKETDRRPGLGLATVLNIIKQHKGDISVDSQEGKGTTFRIYLPRSRESVM